MLCSKYLHSIYSNIDEKYFEKILKQPLPFANCEYEFRISGTVDTDIRIMSFVDTFWGFEVTGGSDQFEPLIIIDVRSALIFDLCSIPIVSCIFEWLSFFQVKRTGLAYRAGIRINDIITRINNVYTDDMTLREAQRLIRKSGRYVQIFVLGYVYFNLLIAIREYVFLTDLYWLFVNDFNSEIQR